MRSNLAILLLLLSTASCASGGITPRAREVHALRGEVDRLNQRAAALQAQIEGLEGGYQSALEAREQALRGELDELQAQVTALHEGTTGLAGEAGAKQASLAAADSAQAPAAESARHKPSRRKPAPTASAAEEPETEPSERVRALMADVAARLQVASESTGEDAQSAARLSRARQLLVEADKAASRRDFPQAEKLAQDAAEVIADVVAGEGTAKAP